MRRTRALREGNIDTRCWEALAVQTRTTIMEFPQNTIAQIIDSEREMVLTAPQRYGKYYDTALKCSVLMTQFIKSIDPDRWVFGSFLSLAKKHHTLALF